MRRKQKRLRKEYRKPLLYIDDIEELYSIFLECSDSVTITAGDNEYSDIEDFKNNNKSNATEFSIDGGFMDISLQMYKVKLGYFARLDGWNNTSERLAAFHNADSVLTKLSRDTRLAKLGWLWACASMAFSVLMWSDAYKTSKVWEYVTFGAGVIFVLGVVVGLYLLSQKQMMVFKKRCEALTFWERNRDKIAVGVIVGVVVAIINVGVPRLFGRRQIAPTATSQVRLQSEVSGGGE